MNKQNGFLVRYTDDFNRKHITFTNKFSDVKFLKERFDNKVTYEPTSYVENVEKNQDD